MDLRRLRFGDWVLGGGGLAVLVVMFLDWYEPSGGVAPGLEALAAAEDVAANAWQAFAITDLLLGLAAAMAIGVLVLTASQPTAAVPLALASLTALVALIALVLVVVRLIWPPELAAEFDTARLLGSWLGLVTTSVLLAGALASIRDERLPRPEHEVKPRLVEQ